MNLLHRCLTSASLLLLVATGTLAQDDTDLIDDLPKERKEATREKPQSGEKAKGARGSKQPNDAGKQPLPRPRNVDLIDDLSPEQKEAAERDAVRKNENAIPDTLADALARALRNSPGILVAEAKVRQAQAELNEVRLSVVQELTLAFQRRAVNKAVREGGRGNPQTSTAIMEDETRILYLLGIGAEPTVEVPQALSGRRSKMGGSGMMGPGMMGPGMMGSGMMGPSMGAMPGMGMMPAMGSGMSGMGGMQMGMGGMMAGGGMGPGAMGAMRGAPAAQGHREEGPSDLPENVRTFLDKRVNLDFDKQPLDDVLEYLQEVGESNISFIIQSPEEWKPSPEGGDGSWRSVTLSLKQVTMRSALQALADLYHCAFVFRDYGILVLGPDVELTETFESFRASGTQMIAPPRAVPARGMGMMQGMGTGTGGMIGPAPVAEPAAPAEKPGDE